MGFTSEIIVTEDNKLIDAYLSALEPEQNFKSERASYTLKKSKDRLIIKISAKDATALKAVINSITGLIALVEKNWIIVKSSN